MITEALKGQVGDAGGDKREGTRVRWRDMDVSYPSHSNPGRLTQNRYAHVRDGAQSRLSDIKKCISQPLVSSFGMAPENSNCVSGISHVPFLPLYITAQLVILCSLPPLSAFLLAAFDNTTGISSTFEAATRHVNPHSRRLYFPPLLLASCDRHCEQHHTNHVQSNHRRKLYSITWERSNATIRSFCCGRQSPVRLSTLLGTLFSTIQSLELLLTVGVALILQDLIGWEFCAGDYPACSTVVTTYIDGSSVSNASCGTCYTAYVPSSFNTFLLIMLMSMLHPFSGISAPPVTIF